jgi:hypothetical protein
MTTTNNEIDLNDDANWDKLFDLCQMINENPDFSDLRKDLIDHVMAENNINPAI